MAARGFIRKTMFLPNLESRLQYRLFLLSKDKIDAINGKKWVKFVAMQQDSATLIYDLNAMNGTMESYLKKNRTGIQNRILPSLKNRA